MKSLKDLMDLSGRVAMITGGAGHLGSALAEGLAELGADIVLLDCDQKLATAKVQALQAQHQIKAVALTVDLQNEEEIRSVPDRLQQLDILVHCAALVGTSDLAGWAVPFEQQRSDTWRRALEVNLTAVFTLTQACYPLLKRSQHGSVIHVGSIYGMVGPDMDLYEGTLLGNPAAYAASKGGLAQLTRWLASNLAPEVRVNTLTPGGIFRDQAEPFLSRYTKKTLLKRMAREEDFKGAVAYLASDLSAYVTGQNLVVDGGLTAC